jgi:hypothetical protein
VEVGASGIRPLVVLEANSFKISIFKTQDLKLFRINTYGKTGRGALLGHVMGML